MSDREPPYYEAVGDERTVFEHCYARQLPLMLKGPTGCGKSRFVEHMAARLGRPLVTVPCHDDTSTADLLGRWLIRGGDTIWSDGPVVRGVREGAIVYLDEIAEARPDIVVALHPLTDHRRQLYIDRHSEVLTATKEFMLVVSFNPGYQHGLKELKPSTRQRFVSLGFTYPQEKLEAKIIENEGLVESKVAKQLVALAGRLRALDELGLAQPPSTRLLVDAAKLIASGLPPRVACKCAIAEPLTDELDVMKSLEELIGLVF